MRIPRLSGTSLFVALLVLLCVSLIYANFRLVKVTKTLIAQRESLNVGKGPVIGSMMTHLNGVDLRIPGAGSEHAKKGTLVLVFSPECAYCKANASNWNDLLKNEPDFNIVLADLSSTYGNSGLAGLSSRSDLLTIILNPEEQLLHNLHVTPTTLLLDCSGKVKGSWPGLLGSADINAILAAASLLQG